MTVIDMTDTIEPRSDQMNADDLMAGPRTFTISRVRKASSADQPVDVYLAEFPEGRPFKPSKSMRRIMVAGWGKDAATYVGHRFTLYRDPDVKFGGQDVGGVRISHMSDLPGGKPLRVALTVTRGKRAPYTVQPLTASAPTSSAVSAETLTELQSTLARKGIPEDKWLAGVNHYTGGAATDLEVITEDQARLVLGELAKRADAPAADAPAGEWVNTDADQCGICAAQPGQPHDPDAHEAAGA